MFSLCTLHCGVCKQQNNPIRGKQRRRRNQSSESYSMPSLNPVAADKCFSESGRVMKSLRQWAASHLRALIVVCFSTALHPPTPDKLCRCQEDSGPLGDPEDICRPLTHVVGHDTSSQMGEGNPRRPHAQFRTRRNGSGNSWQNVSSRSRQSRQKSVGHIVVNLCISFSWLTLR